MQGAFADVQRASPFGAYGQVARARLNRPNGMPPAYNCQLMATTKSQYICNACGASSARWLGKCPSCNAWNSLEEVAPAPAGVSKNRLSNAPQALAGVNEVATLADIKAEEVARTPTGVGELDRVLGGGMVAGGVVLIGGDPGIGKST